jgi:protein-S-isoprenylcysteine O-methyltransferase Ste14
MEGHLVFLSYDPAFAYHRAKIGGDQARKMGEAHFYQILLWAMFGVAGLTLVFSLFTTAPYGRHPRTRWGGPDLPSRWAWLIMELPQLAGFWIWFLLGARPAGAGALALLGLWTFHYTYRTFIYPFLPRGSSMALSVVALGFVLNTGFSYLNGRWLFSLGPIRDASWLTDPRFILGALLFFGGFTLCAGSDARLRRLRAPGEQGHKIPTGGAFRWVSCPNYLGELAMWAGWSTASWAPAGLAILAVTAANLVPRALANHRWYRNKFPDYPPGRRALVPYLF